MDDFRAIAEQRLAAREAKHGPVSNRERYLAAIIAGLRDDASAPAPAAPKTDRRPYCAACDGNGWVDAPSVGGYAFVQRCPACDHGRVNLRAAGEPATTPEVGRAHLAVIKDQLSRLQAKQTVRNL